MKYILLLYWASIVSAERPIGQQLRGQKTRGDRQYIEGGNTNHHQENNEAIHQVPEVEGWSNWLQVTSEETCSGDGCGRRKVHQDENSLGQGHLRRSKVRRLRSARLGDLSAAAAVDTEVSTKGPYDEDNLERLCKDPFHSFLCKPSGGRRRRIDGRLRPQAVIPPGILPESSNLRESKLLPQSQNRRIEQTRDQGYRYPKPERKFEEGHSSRPSTEKSFSYQTAGSSLPSSTKYTTVPTSKSQGYSYSKPTSKPFTLPTKPSTTESSILPQPDPDIDIRFGGPDSLVPESAQNPSVVAKPAAKKGEEDDLERLCSDPFHSFLCKPLTRKRQRIDGNVRPSARLPPGVLQGEGSYQRAVTSPQQTGTTRELRPDSSDTRTAINPNRKGYSYPKPDVPFPLPKSTQPQPTLAPTRGPIEFQPSGRFGDTALRPTSRTTSTSTAAPTLKTGTGYDYSKPVKPFPLPGQDLFQQQSEGGSRFATQEKVSTYGTTGFTYTAPLPKATSRPDTTPKPSHDKFEGYDYPKPQSAFTLPPRTPQTFKSEETGAPSDTHSQISRLAMILNKYNAPNLKTQPRPTGNLSPLPPENQFQILKL